MPDNDLLSYYSKETTSDGRRTELLSRFNISNMRNNKEEVMNAFKFARTIANIYQLSKALPNIVLVINKLFANNNN